MTLRATGDGLAIPDARLTIDPARAHVWDPGLPRDARLRSNRASTDRLVVAAEVARVLAAGRAPSAGFGPLLVADGHGDPWLDAARVRIERQVAALADRDVEAAVEPAVGLIGLGTGLTPSGDDYLVGLLAGLEASGDRSWAPLARAIATAAPSRTTAIGAAMLGHAARGEYTERLHDVLIALADGRSRGLAAAVGRAMAYGATSGADTLVGVFAAVRVATSGRARAAA